MMKEWLLLVGLLIVLHAVLFLGWMAVMTSPRLTITPIVLMMVGYMVLFVIIIVVFTRRLSRATSPREYQEAHDSGIVTTAKILSIKRTRWRIRRNLNFRLQTTPARYEYEMRVRIIPSHAAAYEAELSEFLGGEVPSVGDSISVKIHPQRPEVVVLARDIPS